MSGTNPTNLDELALKECENKEVAVGISPVNRLTPINKNKRAAECYAGVQ